MDSMEINVSFIAGECIKHHISMKQEGTDRK